MGCWPSALPVGRLAPRPPHPALVSLASRRKHCVTAPQGYRWRAIERVAADEEAKILLLRSVHRRLDLFPVPKSPKSTRLLELQGRGTPALREKR